MTPEDERIVSERYWWSDLGYSLVPTADLDRLRAAAEARDRAIADIDFRLAHLHAGGGYTVPRRKAAEAWARAHLNGVRAALGDPAAEAAHVWVGDHGVATGGNVPSGDRAAEEGRPTINEHGRAMCACGVSVLPENWPNHLLSRGLHRAAEEGR